MKLGWLDVAKRLTQGSTADEPPFEASEEGYRRWLKHHIARRLKVDPSTIDEDAPFSEFGLDSRTAVQLSGELEKRVGARLSPALLLEHETIREVALALVASE